MTAEAKMLTREEFSSLLLVGNTSAVSDPPAIIPAKHSGRLIALGYMADIAGRLRMTTPGRSRIAAGFQTGHCSFQIKGSKQASTAGRIGPRNRNFRWMRRAAEAPQNRARSATMARSDMKEAAN